MPKTNTPDPSNADPQLLPARRVWERYGVADRTLDRWVKRDTLGFPKPLVVNGRRYWRIADLSAWERSRATATSLI